MLAVHTVILALVAALAGQAIAGPISLVVSSARPLRESLIPIAAETAPHFRTIAGTRRHDRCLRKAPDPRRSSYQVPGRNDRAIQQEANPSRGPHQVARWDDRTLQ